VYQAWQPSELSSSGWQLAMRTSARSGPGAVALRQGIQDALPGSRTLHVEPWLWFFDTELRARHFLIGVFAAFSAFALALAAVGLYGVVSYSVSQRMREFALRIAVGAPGRDLVKLVAHDAIVMTLAGVGLGAFLAMWGSTLLGEWLFDVHHTDARSLVLAELVLFGAAILACFQPALRAMRADPVEILRAI
jgi:ABC-type antimicrobial peptide transport system permease subunit